VVTSRVRKAFITCAVASIASSAGYATLAVAQPASQVAVVADSDIPLAVEDFAYPGAAEILQNQKIALKRGDGHIMLSDCVAAHDITVKSRLAQKTFCFAVTGKQGYLALELPDAFGMWTEDYPVQAKIVSDGNETVVNAPKNDYTPFGEAGDSAKRSVLVELRVTS
jgi:hypothetical protein